MNTALSKTERVQQALDRAELAMRGFLHDEALGQVELALRYDPGHRVARILEARIQLQRSHPREVLRSLDAHDLHALSEQAEASPLLEVSLMRAASLAQVGQVGMAIVQLEYLAEQAPADVGVLQALASMQVRDGRDQDAIETLTLLCTLDPEDGVSARTLSDLLSGYDPSAAVEALGKVDGSKRRRAARSCRSAGRLLDAERHYDLLLEDHVDDSVLWCEAGALSVEMGEMLRAEDRLRASLSFGGRGGATAREAWSLQAVAWMRRGRNDCAGASWWRAIRSETTADARGWAGLQTCAMLAERPTLMRRVDRVLRSLVTRSERRLLLARCWFDTVPLGFAEPGALKKEAGEEALAEDSPLSAMLAQAEETLAAQAQRFPERADVRYHHAVVLESQDRGGEALEQAGCAVSINPAYRAAGVLRERLVA